MTRRFAIACMLGVALSGCAQPPNDKYNALGFSAWGVRAAPIVELGYSGPAKDPAEVAIVLTNGETYVIQVRLPDGSKVERQRFADNGIPFLSARTYQLHLLPGTYLIEFCFHKQDPNVSVRCSETITRPVELQAGQVTLFSQRLSRRTWEVVQLPGQEWAAEARQHFDTVMVKAKAPT